MKRLLSIALLLFTILLSSVHAQRQHFGHGFYWEFNNEGVLTIYGSGNMPDFFERTEEAPWKNVLKSIRKIIVNEGVTSIGNYAFTGANVQSVELPKTLRKIGFYAFKGCSFLSSINFPDGLKSIGQCAFRLCKNLKAIDIPNSVTMIEFGAFEDCEGLCSITIPNSITEIKDYCFNSNNCSSIIIPNSVTRIGEHAFSNSYNLESVYIPNSVYSIGNMAFWGCSKLQKLAIPPSVKDIISTATDSRYTMVIREKQERIVLYAQQGFYKHFFNSSNDGYYLVEEEGERGVLSFQYKWIIPLGKEYNEIEYIGGNYLKVRKSFGISVIELNGKTIIPFDRNYKSIVYNDANGTFNFTKIGLSGVCNSTGQVVSAKKIPLTVGELKSRDGYDEVMDFTIGSFNYYKVCKGGRYGLTNGDGKIIVPVEMDALENAGGKRLRYKLNGFWGLMNYQGRVLIDTNRGYTSIGDYKSFNKRFAYTMNGYKGECDATGKQISKIKVDTPRPNTSVTSSSASSSTSSNTSNNTRSTGGTQTIVVEHKHDPVPMQVWKQCTGCYGSGMCQSGCGGSGWFTGYSGNSTRCIGCGGSGKCQFCAGQGGHYEVEYR